jgi:hypothetical protein
MDVSGSVELPEDRITRLKKELLELNIAELQHLINFLQKERNDVLIAISFTHSYFTMDVPHFKDFKSWLQAENVIDLDSMVLEAVNSIQSSVVEVVGPQSDDCHSASPVAGHNGPAPPPAEGWGC